MQDCCQVILQSSPWIGGFIGAGGALIGAVVGGLVFHRLAVKRQKQDWDLEKKHRKEDREEAAKLQQEAWDREQERREQDWAEARKAQEKQWRFEKDLRDREVSLRTAERALERHLDTSHQLLGGVAEIIAWWDMQAVNQRNSRNMDPVPIKRCLEVMAGVSIIADETEPPVGEAINELQKLGWLFGEGTPKLTKAPQEWEHNTRKWADLLNWVRGKQDELSERLLRLGLDELAEENPEP